MANCGLFGDRALGGRGLKMQPAAINPQSAIRNPQSNPQSAVAINPQSAIGSGRAAIGNPQSTIRNRTPRY
jgi:hypothetical protein